MLVPPAAALVSVPSILSSPSFFLSSFVGFAATSKATSRSGGAAQQLQCPKICPKRLSGSFFQWTWTGLAIIFDGAPSCSFTTRHTSTPVRAGRITSFLTTYLRSNRQHIDHGEGEGSRDE